jgi:hypothetical protein
VNQPDSATVSRVPFVPPRLNALNAADELACVVRADTAHCWVHTRAGEYRACRAVSCLVEPRCDDLVLCTRLDDGRCYILAVLERSARAELCVALDASTTLSVRDGELQLRARNGIRLVSDGAVGVVGQSIHLLADEGTLLVKSLSLLAERVRVDVSRARLVVNLVDATLARVLQRGRSALP